MDNVTNITEAPLTRRQAREIERRTGVRPVAVAEASVGAAFRHDTGAIKRNDMAALLSVLPNELADTVSEPKPAVETADESRSLTVRAAVPASLVAARRRRAVGSFAAAASIAAAATVGVGSLTAPAEQGDNDGSHLADVSTALQNEASALPEEETAEVAELAPVQIAAGSTTVTEISADAVMGDVAAEEIIVEEPVEEEPIEESAPDEEADAESAATSEDSYTDSGDSYSSNSTPAPAAAPASGSVQQAIVDGAYAQLGRSGVDCTDAAQDALAAAGLTTSRSAGGYDMGVSSFFQFGTVIPASQAQPGDLMVAPGGPHVAIYIGNGQAIHGGWNWGAQDVTIAGVNDYNYSYVRVNG